MKRLLTVMTGMSLIALLAACGSEHRAPAAQPEIQPSAVTENASTATEIQPSAVVETTPSTEAAPAQAPAATTEITEEEAKNIALTDAGVTEADVTGIRVRLETDDGVREYEVDFYVGTLEYDYDIDAATGAIRSKDMDIEFDFHETQPSTAAITEADAIAMVLEKVPGAAESDVRIHLDYDDGRTIYEGSLVNGLTEYDFEIDADSGTFLEWEQEFIFD